MTIASVTRSPGAHQQQPMTSASATTSTTAPDQPGPGEIRGIRKGGKLAAAHRPAATSTDTKLGDAVGRGASHRPSFADAIRDRAHEQGAKPAGAKQSGAKIDAPAAKFGFDFGDVIDDVVDAADDAIDAMGDVIEGGDGGGAIRKPGRQAVRTALAAAGDAAAGQAFVVTIDRDHLPDRTPVSAYVGEDSTAVRKPGIGDDLPVAGGAGAFGGATAARTASFGFDLPDLPDVVDDVIDAIEEVIDDGGGGGGIRKPG